MTWDIQVLPRAEKALTELDKRPARRVRDALVRLAGLEDPASACKALGGPLTGLWRYRVGDYRVILDIRKSEVGIVKRSTGSGSALPAEFGPVQGIGGRVTYPPRGIAWCG